MDEESITKRHTEDHHQPYLHVVDFPIAFLIKHVNQLVNVVIFNPYLEPLQGFAELLRWHLILWKYLNYEKMS